MKKRRVTTPLMGEIFKAVAPKIGARVVMEPEWGIVGQIVYTSGKKRYFRYSSLDLNTLGASEISKDKDYANFFMKRMGYPTVPGKPFFSPAWAKAIGSTRSTNVALAYAQKIGFPVIAKPNSGSQGRGVTLCHSRRELERALRDIFMFDRVALVQRPVSGKDYRIVVLDKKIISAYERIPLSVVGDGRSSVQSLLKKKQKDFVASSRDTRIRTDDPRIKNKLARAGLKFTSIPKKGERVYLLDNANLSTGGDSLDVTAVLHAGFKRLAIELTRDMGLRLCGVDVMVDGDISKPPKEAARYWILEINSAPGLDHYARSGRVQQKIVEDMYLQVLKHMEH